MCGKWVKVSFGVLWPLETSQAFSADEVRQALSIHEEIVHVSVEINSPDAA